MAANYVLLERIELNADASSVVFSNIPQSGYTDLLIKVSSRQTNASIGLKMAINGYSSFSGRVLEGAGSGTPTSYTMTTQLLAGYNNSSAYTANTFASTEIYIPNYTSTTNKSVSADTVTETNGTTAYSALFADLYTTSSPVTTITFTADNSGSIASGSTFSLYGLAAVGTTPVIAPKASGGNRIDNDGTYWYHTFTSTGAFVPQTGLSCDVLVVAGGGGAGYSIGTYAGGAGGGAGGYRTATSLSFASSTSYTATVGAGGAVSSVGSKGTSGSNSVISTITSSGGGGGGASDGTSPLGFGISGGSGGGSTYSGSGSKAGGAGNAGSYSPVEGYAGGNATSTNNGGAGGGGAAGIGTDNPSPNGGGAGGSGSNSLSSWASVTGTGVSGYYAGGGGGGSYNGTAGSGGAGGGGAGGAGTTNGTSGTPNTGGGGGGNGTSSSTPAVPGAGGSGIVIIRYPIA